MLPLRRTEMSNALRNPGFATAMIDSKRIGFIIEQALGHITHAENLRHWVDKDPDVVARWLMIPHQAKDIWQTLPGPSFSMRLSLRARGAIRQAFLREHLDCLYLHTQSLSLFSLGFMKRIPTVISLDATPMNFGAIATAYDEVPSTGIANRIKTAWFRHAFARARGLVAMSDWVKSSLVRDYAVAPDKIRIFPFGVNMQQWQFVPRRQATGRRLRLLFVGGDFDRKGGTHLINAFEHGLQDICELDIVTSTRPAYSGHHVRIHTGLTPNSPVLQKLYAEADLFVLPTRGDATPIAILEAMATGLPVITTRVGAISELIGEGVTGYFVPPADPRSIVEAVRFLAANSGTLPGMGQAARIVVERNFNAEINSKGVINFLKEISSPRPDRNGHP
jgi:glycosyltransferase involved in cell wall biosynthesis